jgi:hypothetical protein
MMQDSFLQDIIVITKTVMNAFMSTIVVDIVATMIITMD